MRHLEGQFYPATAQSQQMPQKQIPSNSVSAIPGLDQISLNSSRTTPGQVLSLAQKMRSLNTLAALFYYGEQATAGECQWSSCRLHTNQCSSHAISDTPILPGKLSPMAFVTQIIE